MASRERAMGRSLIALVPGMRNNAPKRNTIVLLVYLIVFAMTVAALRTVPVLVVRSGAFV